MISCTVAVGTATFSENTCSIPPTSYGPSGRQKTTIKRSSTSCENPKKADSSRSNQSSGLAYLETFSTQTGCRREASQIAVSHPKEARRRLSFDNTQLNSINSCFAQVVLENLTRDRSLHVG